jgi:hypothetical protein
MGKKKKKSKSKSIWSRIRSNPKAFGEILAGFGDMYAASKGKNPNAVVPKGQEQAGAAAPQKLSPTDPLKNYPKLKR